MDPAMKCSDVWLRVSDYLDGKLLPAERRQITRHIAECRRCKSVIDGTRNVVELAGDDRSFDVPAATSRRLYDRLDQYLRQERQGESLPRTIPVGITADRVALGSHLIYFWETDGEFEKGVHFLYPGLGAGEHCIVFGHDEAIERVLTILRNKGYDPEELIRNLELTVLRRHASASATLSDIRDVVQACLNTGATAVRFLGNLGMGRDPLPAGEDDVLELESRVSGLISAIPCVVVCMYDVKTVSGRLVLKGGLQTHHLAVCSEGVHVNPYFEPAQDSPGSMHAV